MFIVFFSYATKFGKFYILLTKLFRIFKKYHVGFCLLPKESTNGRPNDKQFREI